MKVDGAVSWWLTIKGGAAGVDNWQRRWISILDIIFVDKAALFVDKFAALWITRRMTERRCRNPRCDAWIARVVVHNAGIGYRREIHFRQAESGVRRRQTRLALHNPRLYTYGSYESQHSHMVEFLREYAAKSPVVAG